MFKRYCNKKGWYTTQNNATHLFMDGGKLHIPDNDLPQFINKYIECINKGDIVSLVEKLGAYCEMRFFLDVDKIEGINCENIIKVSSKIIGMSPNIYTCTQENGLHIVFNKVVTCEEAIKLCNYIKQKVSCAESNSIDISVYKTGLRMIGSRKFNSKTQQFIERYYVPLGYKNEQFTLNMMKQSIVRLKEYKTSVCKSCTTSGNYTYLQKYMEKINECYKGITITRVNTIGDHYCVNVQSKFCTNINGKHNSHNIYFVICKQKNEMYQKCFCRCNKTENRLYGLCAEYKSKSVKVSIKDMKRITS